MDSAKAGLFVAPGCWLRRRRCSGMNSEDLFRDSLFLLAKWFLAVKWIFGSKVVFVGKVLIVRLAGTGGDEKDWFCLVCKVGCA